VGNILLSHPLIHLYLLYVGALFVIFLCRRPKRFDGATRQDSRRRQETTGRQLRVRRQLGGSGSVEEAARTSTTIKRFRQE
jgi:hypothetical protein